MVQQMLVITLLIKNTILMHDMSIINTVCNNAFNIHLINNSTKMYIL